MKIVANCDKRCELQSYGSHRIIECMMRLAELASQGQFVRAALNFPRNRIELDHPGDLSISLPGGQEIN